jgi:hypothetical protein
MTSWAQLGVSVGAFLAGAAALVWSVLVATGLFAGAFIVLGAWLGVYLSNLGLRKRLAQAVVAELLYNRAAAASVTDLESRGQLATSISTPPLRTGSLFEALSNSALLGLTETIRNNLASVIFQAEKVNDGLRTMRRFQLSVTTDKAENLRNIGFAIGAYTKNYTSAAEELRASFVTNVDPRPRRRRKGSATT